MNNNCDEWFYFIVGKKYIVVNVLNYGTDEMKTEPNIQVNLYECDVIEVGSNQSIHDVMREVVKED